MARGGGGVAAAVLVPRGGVGEALRQYVEESVDLVALRRRQIGHTPSTAAVVAAAAVAVVGPAVVVGDGGRRQAVAAAAQRAEA